MPANETAINVHVTISSLPACHVGKLLIVTCTYTVCLFPCFAMEQQQWKVGWAALVRSQCHPIEMPNSTVA